MILGLLLFFLSLPYILILSRFGFAHELDYSEIVWAFKNTVLQASLSAVFSIIFGFMLARGLIYLKEKIHRRYDSVLHFFILLPNFLPSLYTLLIFLNDIEPFPVGILGLVLVHSFINMGPVALILEKTFYQKLSGVSQLSYVEGASHKQFWLAAIRLLKKDFLALFVFVFTICFCSFAVPLVLGGGKGTTLEVLIFEQIRISNDWGAAISLSLFQLGFIFLLSFLQRVKGFSYSQQAVGNKFYLSSIFGAIFLVASVLWFSLSYVWGFVQGLQKVFEMPGLWTAALDVLPTTVLLGVGVGLGCMLFLIAAAFDYGNERVHRLLNGYVAPSTALIGFSFLFWQTTERFLFLKYIIALVILFVVTLYRMGWSQRIEDLKAQFQTAELLGASKFLIFQKIIWPQVSLLAGHLAGIGAVWAMGDFALARILIGKEMSLSILIDTLMNSYRIETALGLSGILLLASLMVYLLFYGVGRVFDRTA